MKLNLTGIPTRWAICDCCNGDGRIENAAFSSGFTSEEWAEMSADFDGPGEESAATRYLRGDYDQACRECSGSGKVRAPDVARMSFAQKRVVAAARREAELESRYAAESAAEYAAERRMGC